MAKVKTGRNLGRSSMSIFIKLGLVSMHVKLYRACSDKQSGKISLNYICGSCTSKLSQVYVCPTHKTQERSAMRKGYEHEAGKYTLIEQDFLDSIQIQSNKVLDLIKFVDGNDLSMLYFDVPYYIVPEAAGIEAYCLLRDAMINTERAAIGRMVMGSREVTVALAPFDRGIILWTMNHPEQIKEPTPYFADLPDDSNPKILEIMTKLVDERTVEDLETEDFEDHYEMALLEGIKAKIEGKEPEQALFEDEKSDAGDLMTALMGSLQ